MSTGNGGIIGPKQTPKVQSASGIWFLNRVTDEIKRTNWPASSTITLTYNGVTSITVDGTSFTFSGVSIGGPGLIVVLIHSENTSAASVLSSCTIGGLTSTVLFDSPSALNTTKTHAGIAAVRITSGTTADIVVNFTQSQLRCGIGVWRIENNQYDTPIDIETAAAGSGSSSAITFKNVPIGAVGIVAHTAGLPNLTATWTNATERYDTTVETNVSLSGADFTTISTNNLTVTATLSASSTQPVSIIGAIWR